MRLLMKLEKGLEEKDWAWKEGRKLCQRVRLLLLLPRVLVLVDPSLNHLITFSK